MKIIKKISILVGLLSMVLGPLGVVHAARISQLTVENKNDFVLEPGKIEVFLNPGETVTRTVSVISRINKDTKFKVETEDFIGSDNADTPVILLGNDKSPYSFKDNLVPETNEFSLSFGQKIEIPVTITAPADAQPGGFYSSVIISSTLQSGAADAQGGAKIVSRVGVLFFVRINGPVESAGSLNDFRIKGGKSVMQKGPVNFELLFKNEGTVHLVPYGSISIKNIFGKELKNIPVDAYFSLPKSMRYRYVSWDHVNLFGRYTAELTLNRGYDGIEDVQKISFWVIPVKAILIVFICIFVLVTFWKFITSRFEFKRKKN